MAASVQKQVLVKGTFKNELASNVDLMKIETYSGFFQDGGPNAIIEPGHETSFKHNGALPQGSKVGVAYRVPNGDLCVLAWHVPLPGDLTVVLPNKEMAEEQAIVDGSFMNETFVKMELLEIKRYSGFFQDGGPKAILEHNEKTNFIHNGESPKGSKVGVAYRGYGGQWVFAWHVPQPNNLTDLQPNKVLGMFFLPEEKIDWDYSENELYESTNEISDHDFKATITPHGSKAQLHVKFLNIPP